MLYQTSLCQNSVATQNIVVTLDIKEIVVPQEARRFKIVFDYESHEAEGKVDEVSKNDPIVWDALHSMSDPEPKQIQGSFSIRELILFDIVRLHFAPELTENNVIVLTDVELAESILKSECWDAHIEGDRLLILLEVPYDDTVLRRRLIHSYGNGCFVATRPHILDPRLDFLLWEIEVELILHPSLQIESIDFSPIPQEQVVFVAGESL